MNYEFSAPCIFGMESILGSELKRLDIDNVRVNNGRVDFSGDDLTLARANLNSRYAERIYIKVASFKALSFEELFENVRKVDWSRYIGVDDAFPVKGWSLNSKLHSVPDCQAIIKKAIVKSLSHKYRIDWFKETKSLIDIRFSIMKDEVTVFIDTSGEGLHKRGYRRNSNEAPIKETLAAAMCDIARIYPDTYIIDPFCGSGTILIEAALKACNIAPGIFRSFAAEKYSFVDKKAWMQERARATDLVRHDIDFRAYGYDIDESCVDLTLANAKKAGVEKYIKCEQRSFDDFYLPDEKLIVVTNPPYGERLLDIKKAEELYVKMGKFFKLKEDKRYYIISPDDNFEDLFGTPANKRRKLYNGMLKCQLYSYFQFNKKSK